MPVRKFRSIEEMKARKRAPLDPENLRIACDPTEIAYALHPWRLPAGVPRFRSVEEANLRREEWLKTAVRARSTPS
jgi:hypothetical protein